jgi:hypothetical protein
MAELGEGLSGYLDVQDATLRAPRLEAVSNIGIANTAPQHAFSVGSNLYIDTESSNVLTVDGNVVCEGVKVGLIEIVPSYDLAAVSNVGNVTQSTIQFSNATTSFVATANIEVGTANLFVDTTTSRVGVNTATPDASLHVTGNAYVSSNLEVGTANLFVDTVSGRVGIGTSSLDGPLHLYKSAPTNGDTGPGILFTRYLNTYGGCIWTESNNNLDGLYFNTVTNAAGLGYGGTPKMVINSNGHVGIGMNNPEYKLHIEDATDPRILLENTETLLSQNQDIGSIIFKQNDSTGVTGTGIIGKIRMSSVIAPPTGTFYGESANMIFSVGNYANDNANIDALTIRGNGNVGIGTGDPIRTLHVNGTTWLGGDVNEGYYASTRALKVKKYAYGVNTDTLSVSFELGDISRAGIIKVYFASGVSGEATVATTMYGVWGFTYTNNTFAATTMQYGETHGGNGISFNVSNGNTLNVIGTMYSSFSYPAMEVEVYYAGGIYANQ